jgi:hypothetical protein
MKQFGLRYLYKHLGEALKELPFEITFHNKLIAIVNEPTTVYILHDLEKRTGKPQTTNDPHYMPTKGGQDERQSEGK